MAYTASDITDLIDTAVATGTPERLESPSAEWLYLRYLNRAHAMVTSGYADTASIDFAMRGACRLRYGPGQLRAHHDPDVLALWSRRLHAEISGANHTYSDNSLDAYPTENDEQVDPASIVSVGIVGTGVMATGIAQAYLTAGIDVNIAARSAESAARLKASLDHALSRQRTGAAARAAIADHLHIADGYEHLRSCDLVIECVAEHLTVKRAVFSDLDRLCPSTTILATTTSSLHVREIAAVTTTPSRIVGMHFFNPANTMPLVELIAHPLTATRAIAIATSAANLVGKEVVHCGDRPGFIVNALLIPYLNDALSVLRATRDPIDLDKTMRSFGFPMGPVALLELIGLDVVLAIQHSLKTAFGDSESAPDPLLTELVDNAVLGRKTQTTIAEFLSSDVSRTHARSRAVLCR